MTTPAMLSLLGGDMQPTMFPMAAVPSYIRAMAVPTWVLIAVAATLAFYLAAVLMLILCGRCAKAQAR
jgi:hypothetical protein